MKRLDPLALPLSGTKLIEASAGTGKTYTITTLFLRLLLERGLSVDRILVVTFTNAAAAELRQRIRRRLRETLLALGQPAPPAEILALLGGSDPGSTKPPFLPSTASAKGLCTTSPSRARCRSISS
jgi:exodeoxyribonuclease V beta subunit